MRRRNSACWHQDVLLRGRFERDARREYPDLRCYTSGRSRKDVVIYIVTVTIPHYKPRLLTITLANTRVAYVKSVCTNGTTRSPHRYGRRELCIWDPGGAASERWVAEDGLLALIEHCRVHLFKEAYWRETGEWLGPEAPHGDPRDRDRAA